MKTYLVLPPFLCGIKKATALLEQWVKVSVVYLPCMDQFPSQADQNDAKYCPLHLRRDILWSSACSSKGYLIKSSRHVIFCFKRKRLLTFTSVLPKSP